ncbi:MAG: tRNA pseudouridine(55) synthase TruB [Bacteroidales bacterium]|nr:tRNA pseudouridine(55) synthase TruB [Bacteroidales bacterium]
MYLIPQKDVPLTGSIGDYPEGIVIPVDKPYSWTSADVIRKIKYTACRHFGKKNLKVGHAGTLDPLATGVLLVCIGPATKVAEALQKGRKEYVAGVTFGATTASFDLEKPLEGQLDLSGVSRESLSDVLPSFVGEQSQTAPLFSAKSTDGVRAYKTARKLYRESGGDSSRFAESSRENAVRASTIVIDSIDLLDWEDGVVPPERPADGSGRINIADPSGYELRTARLRILCSKGTYIRAVARDLGEALGSGAFLSSLRRTRVGAFSADLSFSVGEALRLFQSAEGRALPH